VADERGRLREFSRAAYRKSFVESRSLAELDSVVTGIPTVAIGDELFWGDDRRDEAAAAATR